MLRFLENWRNLRRIHDRFSNVNYWVCLNDNWQNQRLFIFFHSFTTIVVVVTYHKDLHLLTLPYDPRLSTSITSPFYPLKYPSSHFYFGFLFCCNFCRGVTSIGTQSLLLALWSGVIPGSACGSICDIGNRSKICYLQDKHLNSCTIFPANH